MGDSSGGMLYDQAIRLFRDHAAPAGAARRPVAEGFPAESWFAVTRAGLHLALLPDEAGGFGVTVPDAFAVLRAAGETALPLPLAETMLALGLLGAAGLLEAAGLLDAAGLPAADGPLTIGPAVGAAPVLAREGDGWRLRATLGRIPWGRDAAGMALAAVADGQPAIAFVPAAAWSAAEHANLAGEPRDTLAIDALLPAASVAASDIDANAVKALGAATRCQLIAGALSRITDMAVAYAGERKQFGKPLGGFQAIQQSLAVLAGQAAAASAAADLAADAIEPELRPLSVAAAKSRAGEAAGIGAGIAHQVHGAIGFTEEHGLHAFTRRLWSWRDEFGGEAHWNALLGRHLAAAGPDRLWPELTAL